MEPFACRTNIDIVCSRAQRHCKHRTKSETATLAHQGVLVIKQHPEELAANVVLERKVTIAFHPNSTIAPQALKPL